MLELENRRSRNELQERFGTLQSDYKLLQLELENQTSCKDSQNERADEAIAKQTQLEQSTRKLKATLEKL